MVKLSALLMSLILLNLSCSSLPASAMARKHSRTPGSPVKISFLLTNDLHGHLAPKLTWLASIADGLRALPEYRSGESALYVLDSGDQFQGTLLSNHDEGKSVFQAMNAIGYDAVVPGNHDYDFGPLGWLYDQVTPGATSDNPREVIEGLARSAHFPMLSANTYLKKSIRSDGHEVSLDDQCRPSKETPAAALDFEAAERPSFLKPYVILNKARVRVAFVGLDNRSTTSTTTRENVSDLCFRDEAETYLELRNQLEGKADVFVILIHNGDTDKSKDASGIARKINSVRADAVHLVAAGHTHQVHNTTVAGVQVIQDGANGKLFGRVDLWFDPTTGKVDSSMTESAAGIGIDPDVCDTVNAGFACSQLKFPIPTHPTIDRIVAEGISAIAPIAKKKLGHAEGKIWVNRIQESPLGDALTDALKSAGGTEIAFMNTGGIRTALQKGEILYENLFEVLPFQNQAVVIRTLPWKTLKGALQAAVETCGKYGTLVQSGLKIRYSRNCEAAPGDIDPKAKLLHVETLAGLVLLDSERAIEVSNDHTLSATTLDFLAAGGSGYSMLSGTRIDAVLGIAREQIADAWSKNPPRLAPFTDRRFENTEK